MLKTGLRAQAIVDAKFSDIIKSPQGEIILRYGKKGGEDALIGIGDKQNSKLLDYIKEYHQFAGVQSDYFFLSLPTNARAHTPITTRGLQNIINTWGVKTLRGKEVHPHAMRHTNLQKISDTHGLGTAQKAAGHSNIKTTSKYYTKNYVNSANILDKEW